MIPIKQNIGTASLLFKRADKMGLKPVWLTPNGVFIIKTDQGERYINRGMSSLNSHISAGLAKNKYHTRLILDRHRLPNIPYARPKSLEEALVFLATHQKIIVKPIRGANTSNIHIVSTRKQLEALSLRGCIIEKYIAGKELRYLILNGHVIGVHECKYGTSVDQDRDLERVSYESTDWDSGLINMSIKISRLLGLSFCAVDFLIDKTGRQYVLEVNSRPGLELFHAPSSGPPVDVAKLLLEATINHAA